MEQIRKTVVGYSLIILTMILCILLGNRAVTTFTEESIAQSTHCVVIDPGHGGEDGGAVSRSGIPESRYNLEISLRLNDLLNILGYSTKLVRTTDVSVYTKGESLAQKKASDLKERVKFVNETEGALLISIHQNHYPDEKYSGAQVLYAATEGSEQLAKQLQTALIWAFNPSSKRQIQKSRGIYLLEHIQCPGVLVECGFLSNAAEDRKLQDPAYQKQLCSVIATTASRYLRTLDR